MVDVTRNIVQPIARGVKGIVRTDGAAWTPASVAGLNFGFDVSDLSTITTDLAGTTPVTANGQLVRYVGDLSVNGYNPTQVVDARRAAYNTDGTYHWLTFSGNSDINFDLNPLYDGAAGSDNWACFGVRPSVFTGRYIIGATNDDGFEMLTGSGTSAVIRSYIGTASGDIGGNGTTDNLNTDFVFTQEWNRTAGTLKGWQNQNLEVNLSGTPANKLNGAAAWLGAGFNSNISEFAGRMYCGFLYTTIPSAADKLRIEEYVAAKMGVTL
jgi:hypothetical protein